MRTSEVGSGDQPLFERRPRVAEVAARAGVSTATVDRVINARGGVRKKTVALVEKAIREIVAVDRSRPAHATTFDIFLPASSGRSTEVLAEAFSRASDVRGAQLTIVFVERMNPAALAAQLMDCAQRGSTGVAFRPSTIRWSARLPVRWQAPAFRWLRCARTSARSIGWPTSASTIAPPAAPAAF